MEQNVAILAARSTIGQVLARSLVAQGCGVALLGRHLDGVELQGAAYSSECDLTDFPAVEQAVGEACDVMGGLTGLVNCSGSMMLKPAHRVSREELCETLEANLMPAFATVRAGAKHFGKDGGSIVLISSAAASLGMANHEAIATAKGGIEALMRASAATYATKGIRVNAVAPGLTATKLTERITENEGSRQISESLHALNQIGQPEHIARAIQWLLDPQQSWVTGQVIGVDGGLSRVQPRPRVAAGA